MKQLLLPLLAIACAVLPGAAQNDEGAPYHIFSIFFGGGSWHIDEGQVQELYQWIDNIQGIENHEISIHGHTDDIGSLEYNQWLAHHRCMAALRKLLDKGIPREQITIEEFGEQNPIFDNATWEGKLKNRRVDVIIRPLLL